MECHFKLKNAIRSSTIGKHRKRIFAEEIGGGGKRQYWVSRLETFLEFYSTLSPGSSFYEVIEDDTWVKGYWDIDQQKTEHSKESDYDAIIKKVIEHITKELQNENIKCNLDNFAILDSSTDKKLSVHLILNDIKWFKGKNELLDFTKRIFFINDIPKDEFAYTHNGTMTSIIDLKVYGKFQNFRLIGSRKFGKTKDLEISRLDDRLNFLNKNEVLLSTLVQGEPIEGFIENKHKDHMTTDQLNAKRNETSTGSNRWTKLTKTIETIFETKVKGYVDLNENTVLIQTNNRMICERINRFHKSNHTYLLLNTITMVIVKKCHKCGLVTNTYKI